MISENVSEVKILQAILSSVSSSEIKQPVIRLVTADGNQMMLSVVQSYHEHRHLYDVHLQCPSVFLLCQLRAAVCSKVTPTTQELSLKPGYSYNEVFKLIASKQCVLVCCVFHSLDVIFQLEQFQVENISCTSKDARVVLQQIKVNIAPFYTDEISESFR